MSGTGAHLDPPGEEAPAIRALRPGEEEDVLAVINDGARAYEGVIPDDCWHEPYFSRAELDTELAAGVRFQLACAGGTILAVMGTQARGEVTLIRHAYVRTGTQRRGIGTRLLARCRALAGGPLLVGTWAAAHWAIAFYLRNGFTRVSASDKDRLLRRYWDIPDRQIETSVVLSFACDERG